MQVFELQTSTVTFWKDAKSDINTLSFFSLTRILNLGFILPKRPNLHRAYIVSGPKLFLLSVSEKEHYFGEYKEFLTGSTDGLRLVFSLVSLSAKIIWE